MRYILALMPSKQNLLIYIQAAQQAFAPINDGYLLKDNENIPHLTICAFQCDESKISEIWSHIQQWRLINCSLRMTGLMLKKGKTPPYHYSVGLSVARDPQLLHLHHLALELLESYEALEILEAREQARGDRCLGSARGQYFKVHENVEYDIEIDTHSHSPEENVKKIKNVLNQKPSNP